MEKAIRDLFAAIRADRDWTQGKVATQGGVKQSTISKIEIEPDYEPSLAVFIKALRGLGLTASSFFAQIEALKPPAEAVKNLPPQPRDPDDLPAFYSEERIAQNVLRLLTKLAVEGDERREKERPADYRLPANARPLAAERRPYHRKGRRRNVPPETKKRPPEK